MVYGTGYLCYCWWGNTSASVVPVNTPSFTQPLNLEDECPDSKYNYENSSDEFSPQDVRICFHERNRAVDGNNGHVDKPRRSYCYQQHLANEDDHSES